MSERQFFCKSCGARIFWQLTINKKRTPVNLDGTTHWATCPNAKNFKLKKPRYP